MASMDDFGKTLDDIIDQAINTGNYKNLTRHVNDSVNDVIDDVERAFRGSSSQRPRQSSPGGTYRYHNVKVNGEYADRVRTSATRTPYTRPVTGTSTRVKQAVNNVRLYASDSAIASGATIRTVFGGILTFAFGLGMIGVLSAPSLAGFLSVGVFLGLSVWLLWSGITRSKDRRLFDTYKQILQSKNGQNYVTIDELAAMSDQSKEATVKSVERMIKRKWFLQGHLDRFKTTLMTDNDTYRLYLQSQKNYNERATQEANRKKAEDLARKEKEQAEAKKREEERTSIYNNPLMNEQAKEIVVQGRQYIDEIHALNDAIPGAEISSKISKMEENVSKIINRVEAHPEQVTDIRKLMNYYLPTTIKLLKAYEEMDSEQVSGKNVRASKREIEGALDSLNGAYEKLLDSLFADTRMDVASDISVLHTMLTREGYENQAFVPEEGEYATMTGEFTGAKPQKKQAAGTAQAAGAAAQAAPVSQGAAQAQAAPAGAAQAAGSKAVLTGYESETGIELHL